MKSSTMKHLVMSKPQCLLYSAAMVLDISVDDLINIIGHDGLKSNDGKLVGVHIQEIQTACYLLYRELLSYVELIPVSKVDDNINPIYVVCSYPPATRLQFMIKGKYAILIGENNKGNPHAVAYDGEQVLDPVGTKYSIDDFRMKSAWIRNPMRCQKS